MTKINANLIYDIGLFDGEDTAYYLFRGYNVVSVDANPVMVEKARARFAKEIAAKRLTLLNVGIAEQPGKLTFWLSDLPEWSSFDVAIASRKGTPHKPVEVPVVPFAQLLAEHGTPHYLKIDIEGNDKLCIDALKGATTLPKFASVESECAGESAPNTDEESLSMLEAMHDVGYQRFKLVNQVFWTPVRANAATHFSKRLVTSVARGRFRVPGLSSIANKFTDSARIAKIGHKFASSSSGPWGEDIPGLWMNYETAKATYLREKRAFSDRERPWYDWHATV
jgi:FkbM family methyltransferase